MSYRMQESQDGHIYQASLDGVRVAIMSVCLFQLLPCLNVIRSLLEIYKVFSEYFAIV